MSVTLDSPSSHSSTVSGRRATSSTPRPPDIDKRVEQYTRAWIPSAKFLDKNGFVCHRVVLVPAGLHLPALEVANLLEKIDYRPSTSQITDENGLER